MGSSAEKHKIRRLAGGLQSRLKRELILRIFKSTFLRASIQVSVSPYWRLLYPPAQAIRLDVHPNLM